MKLSSPNAREESSELSRALILILLALVAACFLRLPSRELKPMHTDETTQAVKLHEMMQGEYLYDPVDHHGPTLLYSARPLLWITGTDWEEATESKLRLVPALYGLALLVLLLLAADGMGKLALGWAAVFIAVSPIMVFYSRYFIMEVLLVFFTFGCIGCGWRYWITRETKWLVWAGLSAGAMHATKETCVLHFAAMGAALLAVYIVEFWSAGAGLGVVNRSRKSPVKGSHLLIFVLSATAASVALYSQFFTEWKGVADSAATYLNMIGRAGGQGHEKGFTYYLELLWGGTFTGRPAEGLVSWKGLQWALGFDADARRFIYTEGALMLLAFIGCVSAFTAKPARNQSTHLVRFLAVYSVATFLIYAIIRYKTPWCIMGAWHGLLLMAGLGAEKLVSLFWNRLARRVATALLTLVSLQLGLQAWRMSRAFAADSRNPLNYSMTSPGVIECVAKLERIAELSPEGRNMRIFQIDPNGGWPMPWFLGKRFPNYVWKPGTVTPDPETAAVMLFSTDADTLWREQLRSAGQLEGFDQKFAKDFVTLHTAGSLSLYVKKELWDQYVSRQPWPALSVQQ